ncbi:MAG: hypothetical protein JNM68_02440 [Dinghuibacter sp.]|nr:hypothetical protein [Dinghuibacter sp.]
MKKLTTLLLCAAPFAIQAQTVLTKGVIKAKMETTTDNNNTETSGVSFQMAGNETEFTIFLKDSMRKAVLQSNVMNNITLYDGNTGVTTVLTESMGEKTGYTQTPADKLDQKRRMDSVQKAAENGETPASGGGMVVRTSVGGGKVVSIEYIDEAKQINKINCKKALVTLQGNDGANKVVEVWYTPDYLLPPGVSIGRGAMNMAGLKGLPIMYDQVNTIKFGNSEMSMISHYEVTAIDTQKEVSDKEFEIPKGYKIKTWGEYVKDNPDGMPGMRRTFRISQ